MITAPSEIEAIETWPLSASFIDCFLPNSEEREKFNLMGDSAGFTTEDIEAKVRKVNKLIQVKQTAMNISFSSFGPADLLDLVRENASLRQEMEQIKQKLSDLEDRVPKEKVIVLRELPREAAKQEIRRIFSDGRTLYYSDIAEELKIDLELAVDICHELQESGEIKIDERVL